MIGNKSNFASRSVGQNKSSSFAAFMRFVMTAVALLFSGFVTSSSTFCLLGVRENGMFTFEGDGRLSVVGSVKGKRMERKRKSGDREVQKSLIEMTVKSPPQIYFIILLIFENFYSELHACCSFRFLSASGNCGKQQQQQNVSRKNFE